MSDYRINQYKSSKCVFDLNFTTLDLIFRKLSIPSLLQLRVTCSIMRKAVDSFIARTFQTIKNGNFQVVSISCLNDLEYLRCMSAHSLRLVKELTITKPGLCIPMKIVQNIRNNLKILKIVILNRSQHSFDEEDSDADLCFCNLKFIELCTNLTHLNVKIIDAGKLTAQNANWLLRRYPRLEYFEFDRYSEKPTPQINEFFKLNSGIKLHTFSTSCTFLIVNENASIFTTNKEEPPIQFKRLQLCTYENLIARVYDFLNQLHEGKINEHLDVNVIGIIDQYELDGIASVLGIEKFQILAHAPNIQIDKRSQVKEIILPDLSIFNIEECMKNGSERNDVVDVSAALGGLSTATAIVAPVQINRQLDPCAFFTIERCRNTTDLEQLKVTKIVTRKISIDEIFGLIRHFKNLRHLEIDAIDGSPYVLNGELPLLDKARKKLDNASKLTIFIAESPISFNMEKIDLIDIHVGTYQSFNVSHLRYQNLNE